MYVIFCNDHRRVSEKNGHTVSDSQVTVLEAINRRASIKDAKEQAESTQKEYIQAEAKARAQEDTVRKVHQKQVDLAMDVSLYGVDMERAWSGLSDHYWLIFDVTSPSLH